MLDSFIPSALQTFSYVLRSVDTLLDSKLYTHTTQTLRAQVRASLIGGVRFLVQSKAFWTKTA
jgi:hypothetical protein